MKLKLKWFWIEFERDPNEVLPLGLGFGCGVTAWTSEDAFAVFQDRVVAYLREVSPTIKSMREIKSLDELEQNHVLPNIGNPVVRGVWYPNL
jgi:hypothetical protein